LEVHAVSQQLMAAEHAYTDPEELLDDPRLPKLFTLVTDLAFLNEPQIVWESLEDVEGGLSEFYDWKLTRSRLKNSAPNQISHSNPTSNQLNQSTHSNGPPRSNTDTELVFSLCIIRLMKQII
jgi:hypothetical protein